MQKMKINTTLIKLAQIKGVFTFFRKGDYSINLFPGGRTQHCLGNVLTPSRIICFLPLGIKLECNIKPRRCTWPVQT
jgi:hypothetical protein